MKKVMCAFLGIAVLAFVGVFGCTTASSMISGVVESIEVRKSIPAGTAYRSYDVWQEPNFVAVTVLANNGTTYYAALPETFSGVHGIRLGDEVLMTLGRTAFRTTLQERLTMEKDGTVRVLQSTTVGWRLIEEYKIEKRPDSEAK